MLFGVCVSIHNNVDFPEPDGPMIASKLPLKTSFDTSCRIDLHPSSTETILFSFALPDPDFTFTPQLVKRKFTFDFSGTCGIVMV